MTGTAEEICNRLYISEADYENFKDFYNKNKNLCTTYLFRYQTSDYIAMEAATWETDNGSFWEGDGIIRTYTPDRIDSNNYFFQQTVNLDFDIIGENEVILLEITDYSEGVITMKKNDTIYRFVAIDEKTIYDENSKQLLTKRVNDNEFT